MEEHLTLIRRIGRKVGASMKTTRAILVVVLLLFGPANLIAKGSVGLYGIIEKIIFER
jgi:hypothetical protein